jgi:hypothetical protein
MDLQHRAVNINVCVLEQVFWSTHLLHVLISAEMNTFLQMNNATLVHKTELLILDAHRRVSFRKGSDAIKQH